MYLKVLGKQGLAKHKINTQEEKIKIRAEMKGMKMERTVQRIIKAKN